MNNHNPLDAFPYLQQMTQQFRQMFGDDFVKNLMSSMQTPLWNQQQGAPGVPPDGGPSGQFGSGPEQRGAPFAANLPPRGPAAGAGPGTTGSGSGPGATEWPNWMGQWNPFAQGSTVGGPVAGLFPPIDLYETRHELVLLLEIPGLERASDVRLAVFPDKVIVKGDRKRAATRAYDGTLVQSERIIGPFERTILLPSKVRKQHAKATYTRGLLEVRLVKESRAGDPDANIIDVDFL